MRQGILWFAVAAAILRIFAIYPVASQTFDEGHFAAGMEYLEHGSYTIERQHPPLARLAMASVPYISGARLGGGVTIWAAANEMLTPWVLAAARFGVIPFFILACCVLWSWTHRMAGYIAAGSAVTIFTMIPPVLAHAGLATLDMACAAMVFAACYAWFLWLRNPGYGLALGLSVAGALLVKFSALLFIPVLFVVIAIAVRPRPIAAHLQSGCVAIAAALAAILLVYRGDFGAFFQGINEVLSHNEFGHESWLLGQRGTEGWWYFFPVVLAVKTPIIVLVMALAAVRIAPMPVACAATVLVACMPSRINLGVRHILVVYPFLAMAAGIALAFMWRHSRVAVCCLLATLGVQSVMAAPDYLAYFNETVRDPAYVLAESDLDWGQDLGRLAGEMKRRGVDHVWLSYFGSADPARAGIRYQPLVDAPVTGWVAVSVHSLTIGNGDGHLDWLKAHKPVALIGKSMRLYRI